MSLVEWIWLAKVTLLFEIAVCELIPKVTIGWAQNSQARKKVIRHSWMSAIFVPYRLDSRRWSSCCGEVQQGPGVDPLHFAGPGLSCLLTLDIHEYNVGHRAAVCETRGAAMLPSSLGLPATAIGQCSAPQPRTMSEKVGTVERSAASLRRRASFSSRVLGRPVSVHEIQSSPVAKILPLLRYRFLQREFGCASWHGGRARPCHVKIHHSSVSLRF